MAVSPHLRVRQERLVRGNMMTAPLPKLAAPIEVLEGPITVHQQLLFEVLWLLIFEARRLPSKLWKVVRLLDTVCSLHPPTHAPLASTMRTLT